MKLVITKHGKKRLKQRLGLQKKSHNRHLQKVFEYGEIYYRDLEKNIICLWYDYRQYIFEEQGSLEKVLITVFPRNRGLL